MPARTSKQAHNGDFDDSIVGRGQNHAPSGARVHNPFDDTPIPTSGGGGGDGGDMSPDRTLAQLASDSLDEFYQDEQVKENMSTVNVGYRGFTTFGGGGMGGGVNLNSTGGSNNSVPR